MFFPTQWLSAGELAPRRHLVVSVGNACSLQWMEARGATHCRALRSSAPLQRLGRPGVCRPTHLPVWHSSSRSCARWALGSSRALCCTFSPPRHSASWDPQPCPLRAETTRLLGALRAEPGSSVWVGAGRLWAHSDGSQSQGPPPCIYPVIGV